KSAVEEHTQSRGASEGLAPVSEGVANSPNKTLGPIDKASLNALDGVMGIPCRGVNEGADWVLDGVDDRRSKPKSPFRSIDEITANVLEGAKKATAPLMFRLASRSGGRGCLAAGRRPSRNESGLLRSADGRVDSVVLGGRRRSGHATGTRTCDRAL